MRPSIAVGNGRGLAASAVRDRVTPPSCLRRQEPARQGLGRAHACASCPTRPDPALHRAAPDPRGHEPAGVRDAARDEAAACASRERTFATVDHIIPTHSQQRPLADALAEEMMRRARAQLRASTASALRRRRAGKQGIVHVIGPELGLTQPGMTIACGDSHTSTHGAFGAIAFGIGTSQVRDVLATQCLALARPKVAPHRGHGQARRAASTRRT